MTLPTETFVLILTLFIVLFILYSYIQKRIRLSEELYADGITLDAYFTGFGLERMDTAILISWCMFALIMLYYYFRYRIRLSTRFNAQEVTMDIEFGPDTITHQQEDVFNISSRVQGQENQWPTHDAHLSIDHIRIMNEMNKPPSYNDDPPSYEEAIRIAALNQQGESSTPTVIIVAPKLTTTN